MAPGEIRQAFIDANANLRADNIAVTCARGELIDVRICVSRNLKAFATCPQVARNELPARLDRRRAAAVSREASAR